MQIAMKCFCLLLSLLMTACATPEEVLNGSLAIENVTVIDPATRTVREHQSVLIENDRIVAVFPSGEDDYTAVTVIDGSDRFLIPGLMDMHVHVAHPNFSQTTLLLMLANGVTGVREMSGDCWEPRSEIFACIDEYRELQKAIDAGNVPGPRLLRISSAIVRGPGERQPPHVPEGAEDFVTPSDADQARRLVTYLEDRNVDFIKTYNWLSRESYLALLDEAAKRGIEVSGHVPMPVSVTEAVEHGHRTIEHAKAITYDCSDYGPELREWANSLFDENTDAKWRSDAVIQQAVIDGFNAERCEMVLKQLAGKGTWYVPTHETREMDAMAGTDAYRNDQRLEFIDPQLRGFWQRDVENTASQPADAIETHRRFFDLGLRITRMAHEAGVSVMAGTDANDTMSFPGFSLHDELAHLRDAGLPPMDVLRTATATPANYLERDDLGGISPGMMADLVLLDANPLEDIRNTTQITTVIFNGKAIDRERLDRLLAQVKELTDAPWWADIEIVDVATGTLRDYTGEYVVPSSGLEITVSLKDGDLQVTAPGMPLITLYAESESLFFMKEDQTKFEFLPDNGGMRIIWADGRSEVANRKE